MGELIDGKWHRTGVDSVLVKGALHRKPSIFRNWITRDGSSGFRAEVGRYHLYVSLACPWAHRTLIMRNLKGLQSLIGVSVVHWLMGEDGWTFSPGPGVVPDEINGTHRLYELYVLPDPSVTTRATVPILWDKQRRTVVSNESAEILRMFNSEFDGLGALPGDYYPRELRKEIDAVNDRIYTYLNNGVYRAGFATEQDTYEAACAEVFETLDWLEERLSRQAFLVGEQLTEADIRLFTTLIRFDAVYHGHFKCNRRALIQYPALWDYTRALYQLPAVRPTVDFTHIKRHYYESHPWVNPSGIVPLGPERNFDAPSQRLRLPATARQES
jgi:glutathionyl-hydroquinone reductase